ncbi:exonuclease SbcCD subunit D C-terminal domain-containing protein [Methanogenium marinum]|uniref:Nuclease SbcCD subunit D n=2 Tax=Methanogenium marinum TaxID=348610 RepID=A0A9Q4KU56_9EURY|nr:exonuclease SbcCD subunit D C-terminal domain-containing protein [Methanogenium marinum]
MTLCGRRRDTEAAAFLDWLADVIERESVDLLLVTGDIFDNGTPSARSQTLYYRFLTKAAAAGCRHIIITAGNHDSPAFLEAPHEILEALNIHVVGTAGAGKPGGTFLLDGSDKTPQLIVAAVPFLRDRDIRRSAPGASIGEKASQVREGVRSLYNEAWEAACAMQPSSGPKVPVIITGHLFAAGGKTIEGDGVRDQVAGFIERVGADIFPTDAAYVALGHLHVPQTVAGINTIRYPGSPIPVGFGEAEQRKEVILVTTGSEIPTVVRPVPVPQFRRLATIQGDLLTIRHKIGELRMTGGPVWAEVIYNGSVLPGDLMGEVTGMTEGSEIEVLKVKDIRLVSEALSAYQSCEELEELTETEVFERCMETADIPSEQQERLMATFREVLSAMDSDGTDGGNLS